MWCSVCQNDVATEVGADNRRVSCSNCGHLLSGNVGATPERLAATTAASSGPDTRAEEARQLLDRWAKGHFFDPYGPPKKTGVNVDSSIAVRTENEQSADTDHRDSIASDPGQQPVQPVASPALEASSVTAASTPAEPHGRKTIDERGFVANSQSPPSHENLDMTASQPQRLVGTNGFEPVAEALDGPSATSIREPERQATAPGLDAAASAAELDRLTREIMDRVSKLTEARETASDQQTGDRAAIEHPGIEQPSVAAGGADSVFASGSVEVARQQDGSSDHDNSRHSETSIRIDAPHPPASAPAPSQFAASTNAAPAGAAPANASSTSAASNGWYNNVGQMLAYLGIISLTAGTCGVIVSYFGGPANYAPYGWLGATIGQMLLFLGIVTLISAGMEQTSQELRQAVDQRMDEVTQRLDLIGSRIMRIEEASSDGPPRPHLITPTAQESRRTARQFSQRAGSDE
jgi:hypothetical protein